MGLIIDDLRTVDVEFEDDDSGPLLGGPAGDALADGSAAEPVPHVRPRLSCGATVTSIRADDVTPAEIADEVQAQRARYRFSAVRICATIRHDDVQVDEVRIAVTLEPDGFAADPPTAWSLDPKQLVKAYRVPVSFEAGVELSLVAGVKLSARFEPAESDQWWLCGSGELQPDPDWVLRRRQNVELLGDHDLRMVVRHPVDTPCRARLAISGRLRQGPHTWWRKVSLPPMLRTLDLPMD